MKEGYLQNKIKELQDKTEEIDKERNNFENKITSQINQFESKITNLNKEFLKIKDISVPNYSDMLNSKMKEINDELRKSINKMIEKDIHRFKLDMKKEIDYRLGVFQNELRTENGKMFDKMIDVSSKGLARRLEKKYGRVKALEMLGDDDDDEVRI